mmetsp:Transcript_25629/g.59232  ORF Transcript_25629/g.59232 Transcript_25629/m.59232 type:complete len:212 (+) Transcript_25629:520-1155(+)
MSRTPAAFPFPFPPGGAPIMLPGGIPAPPSQGDGAPQEGGPPLPPIGPPYEGGPPLPMPQAPLGVGLLANPPPPPQPPGVFWTAKVMWTGSSNPAGMLASCATAFLTATASAVEGKRTKAATLPVVLFGSNTLACTTVPYCPKSCCTSSKVAVSGKPATNKLSHGGFESFPAPPAPPPPPLPPHAPGPPQEPPHEPPHDIVLRWEACEVLY